VVNVHFVLGTAAGRSRSGAEMKITTNDKKKNTTRFGNIFAGAVFYCGDNYYMKTGPSSNTLDELNAVNLKTGKIIALLSGEPVEPVEADLHVTHY
jgi:hypothetical protein